MKQNIFTINRRICFLFFTISLILTAISFIIEEGLYTLNFLCNANEIFGYLLFSILFSILPIAIYLVSYKINKLRNLLILRLVLSILIGYLPLFILYYFQLQ